MWRHGDILLQRIDAIPEDAVKLRHTVLESSRTTGHKHQIAEKRTCRLYSLGNEQVLEVFAEQADLVHPEHKTITLQQGIYRVWRQREFIRGSAQTVLD